MLDAQDRAAPLPGRQGVAARAHHRDGGGGQRRRFAASRPRSGCSRCSAPPSDPQLADAAKTLAIWLYFGSHRRDKDAQRRDTTTSAPCRSWTRGGRGPSRRCSSRRSGRALYDRITGMIGLDNEPNNHGSHLGSAYQDGWYGYVQKDLRRLLGESVQQPFSRGYCGGGEPGPVPSRAGRARSRRRWPYRRRRCYQTAGCTNGDETCFDAVRFRADRSGDRAVHPAGSTSPPTSRRWRSRGIAPR